jgi:hypothetical protein
MGVAKWQWVDDLAQEYPDKKDELEAGLKAVGLNMLDDLTEDRPKDASTRVAWVDRTNRRMMVAEMYHREGQTWRRCVFHAGGVLEYGDSAYLDERGRPSNPIVAQSCYVDQDNQRYGAARDMIDPQDEINKRSSKLLHELNTRQVQETGVGTGRGDVNEVRKEAARPDGVLPSGWQIIQRQDVVAGQAQLLQNAMAAIERFAPNPAQIGRSNNASGRQDLIRQQAGLTEQAVIFDGFEDWQLRVYRQMWLRARQYMTAPDFVRVTDDEGAPQFIGINQPPTMPGPPTMGPDGQMAPGQPVPGQPIADPANPAQQLMVQGKPAFQMPDGSQVLGYENALAELDVDIILDTVPDTASVQQEQFEGLIELAKIYGPQEVPFDDVLEASSMPNKRKVLERRKARMEQGATDPTKQLAMKAATAKIEETESKARLNDAKTVSEKLSGASKVASPLGPMADPAAGGPFAG